MRKKAYLTPSDRLKRQYMRFKIISLSVIAILFGGLAVLVYTNYDYLIFKNLIAHHYIHTETLDTLFANHLGIETENFGRNFDNLVISIVTREIRQVSDDRYTYQYTPVQRTASIEGVRTRAASAEFYEIAPGIAYVFLPNISSYVRDFVMDNRHEINQFDNLILDLRGNTGGVLDDFHAIAELFLERGVTIGYETARQTVINWIFGSHRRSRGNQFFEFDNIVILQNHNTASASEGLIMALKENLDNVTTIGTLTYGKGIGQATLPLRGGFAVRATVILIETPSGNTVHDIGITPDIEFEGEGIVEFALNWIAGESETGE